MDYKQIREPNTHRGFRTFWRLSVEKRLISHSVFITIMSAPYMYAASDFVPRKYAYCSDTAYFPEMIPQIEGVDLLYHEATFTSEDEQQAVNAAHSTAAQAATIAKDAHVKQLAIGHYSIRYDDETPLQAEAQGIFPNTVASQEGMTISL